MAFAASLVNSDDQMFTFKIFERSTHVAYTSAKAAAASRPAGVGIEPIRMRSGFSRSLMAVPSARNSGFDRIWKVSSGRYVLIYVSMSAIA